MSDILGTKTVTDNVCRMAMLISLEDATELVDEFGRMDTLMPLIDPTGYMTIRKTAPLHEGMARAFLTFRMALEKIKEAENDE